MKHVLILAIGVLSLLTACSQGELAENIRETIYVRNKGADIPAYVYGNTASKTFIIVLHGGPGGSGIEYRGEYSQELEKDYALVYSDQRGQGTSHGHYSSAEVTIATMAEDLYVLTQALRSRYGDDISLFMMGHSWGGTLGTAFVLNADYRSELKGWIEVDGAHDIPLLNRSAIAMFKTIGAEEIAKGNSTDQWQEIVDFANGVDTTNISTDESGEINQKGYTAEGLITEVQASSAAPLLSPLYINHAFTSFYAGGITASQLDAEVEAASYTSLLSQVDIPTLLLWGKYDFVVPPRLGYTAMAELGTADKELVIFEKSGHSPMDNEADLFVAIIKDFVDERK